MIKVEVEGIDELADDFDRFNDRFKTALTSDIGPEIAQVMYANAVKNVPVDTGRLRQSLTAGKAVIRREDGSDEVFIGATTNVEYAPYVEYGTGTKGDPSVPHVPKDSWWSLNPNWEIWMPERDPKNPRNNKWLKWYAQAPNPFMGTALKQTEKIAIKMMTDGIEEVFD